MLISLKLYIYHISGMGLRLGSILMVSSSESNSSLNNSTYLLVELGSLIWGLLRILSLAPGPYRRLRVRRACCDVETVVWELD